MIKKDQPLEYYARLDATKVLLELDTNLKGLSDKEAKSRWLKFGPNTIIDKKERSLIFEFISHFKSPLVIILLVVTVVSAYFGETTNAIIIGIMVILSVALDFFEEHHAGQAAKKLKDKVRTMAVVMRDGKKKEVKTSSIVLGDIICLSAGNLVSADARIIESKDLFVNQSSLTGESFPAEKHRQLIREKNLDLPAFNNLVFFGTSVVSGVATAVVVKAGKETEFGKIADKLIQPTEKSEFEIGVSKFGYFTMKVIIFLVLFIFLFNSLINHNIIDSFMFAIAVAVGITPELLPMIMSITMARGSLSMAKKGVIVKRLAAIPNFGSMDILCTDKTGTLTEDKIELVTYTDIDGVNNERLLLYTYLNSFHQTGVKNPLDEAVMNFKKVATKGYKKVDEIPFDFFRRVMSVVVDSPKGRLLIAKGAPEEIFKRSATCQLDKKQISFTKHIQNKALKSYQKLSEEGYRVLAVAIKPVSKNIRVYSKKDEADLELLGFVAFLDPPKQGLKQVLEELQTVGVEIKVITGDNELVATKICQEVGLHVKGVILSQEMEQLTDEALRARAEGATIFARFSPEEKNRVIHALRANGHVVGYLGDGINDAPSLKTADVGISVNNAVDVAKESADIVLTQKNLQILKDGLMEGRKSFGNTMKYIMMGLSSNFGNMFSMAGAIFFLPFLPMLPIQILLNNFLYDVGQVTIPTDNVDADWLQKPRRWNLHFIKRFMYFFGPISSIFDFTTFFILYSVFHANQAVFQTGWFMESLATQTLVIHFIRTKQLPFIKSTASKYLLWSTIICVALGWIIPYTIVGRYFQFTPLPLSIMLSIAGIVLVYFVVVELGKRIFFKRYDFNISAHSRQNIRRIIA